MVRRHRTAPPAPVQRVLPDFRQLPARVRPEDMVTSEPASLALDPNLGRDVDQEFVVRYGLAAAL